MSAAFGRDALLDAFDRMGRAASQAATKLQIAVAEYLLALRLKAFPIMDLLRGKTEHYVHRGTAAAARPRPSASMKNGLT
jgi:hypothetical protein